MTGRHLGYHYLADSSPRIQFVLNVSQIEKNQINVEMIFCATINCSNRLWEGCGNTIMFFILIFMHRYFLICSLTGIVEFYSKISLQSLSFSFGIHHMNSVRKSICLSVGNWFIRIFNAGRINGED